MVTFREAMDALCVPAGDVAEMFGLSVQTVRQMRMEPDSPAYRTPPAGWRASFAKLARQRGGDMEKLARDLDSHTN
jgi:hypothetical protein